LRGYSITLYEMKPEPVYVTYMSVYPLLDPFQKYLGISVVYGLMVYTTPANTTVGNENVLVGFFFRGKGGEYSTKGGCASNFREDDNMFLCPCVKISLSAGCFLKAGPISGACIVEFI